MPNLLPNKGMDWEEEKISENRESLCDCGLKSLLLISNINIQKRRKNSDIGFGVHFILTFNAIIL